MPYAPYTSVRGRRVPTDAQVQLLMSYAFCLMPYTKRVWCLVPYALLQFGEDMCRQIYHYNYTKNLDADATTLEARHI